MIAAAPRDVHRQYSGLRSFHPSVVFVVISFVFGPLVLALVPPMRGPDEAAHFVRAYAIARGEILPSTIDTDGRKGALIPQRLQREMEVIEFALRRTGEPAFSYRDGQRTSQCWNWAGPTS